MLHLPGAEILTVLVSFHTRTEKKRKKKEKKKKKKRKDVFGLLRRD